MTDEELNERIAQCLPELMNGWAEVRCFTGHDDMWAVIEAMEQRGFWWRIHRSRIDECTVTFNGGTVYEMASDTQSPGRAVVKAALQALDKEAKPR